jgi:hypothetical protein
VILSQDETGILAISAALGKLPTFQQASITRRIAGGGMIPSAKSGPELPIGHRLFRHCRWRVRCGGSARGYPRVQPSCRPAGSRSGVIIGLSAPFTMRKGWCLEYQLVTLNAGYFPSGLAIKSLGAGRRRRCKPHPLASCSPQHRAGAFEQQPAESASFVCRVDKERKNAAVSWIRGRKPDDVAIFVPNKNPRICNEPSQDFNGASGWVAQLVLVHSTTISTMRGISDSLAFRIMRQARFRNR